MISDNRKLQDLVNLAEMTGRGQSYAMDLHTFEKNSAELETCYLLYSLVRRLLPLKVVQVGTCEGISSAFIAQGLEDNGAGTLWTIDVNRCHSAREFIKGMDLEHRICFLQGDSKDMPLPMAPFKMAFIDGDHHYAVALNDLLRFGRLLAIGGWMLHHDTGLDPGNAQKASIDFMKRKGREFSRFHIPASVGYSVGLDLFQRQHATFLEGSNTPDTWQEYHEGVRKGIYV